MATTASRTVTIVYSGDVAGTEEIAAADNTSSPASIQPLTLTVGNNTINVPSGGTTPVACTIVPPSDNTSAITLKGIAGDTGIALRKTDPTTIAIDPSVTSFILSVATANVNVRLFWS